MKNTPNKAPHSKNDRTQTSDGKGLFSRRNFLVSSAVIAALSGIKIFCDNFEQKEKSLESETAELIKKLESSFKSHSGKILPLIDMHITDKELKSKFIAPFKIIKANKDNPYKNFETSKTVSDNDQKANLDYFFYGKRDHYQANQIVKGDLKGTFIPKMRLMLIDSSFNAQSVMDFSTAYHESVHVKQDNKARQNLREKAQNADPSYQKDYDNYVKLFYQDDVPQVFLPNEMEAFASQIELLNLAFNNQIKAFAASKNVNFNLKNSAFPLKTSESELSYLDFLIKLGMELYSYDETTADYPQSFREAIARNYRDAGYLVYDINEEKNLFTVQ